MATRIKDWEVPYTWWIGIEITNNHVINVLLRELNNLIHVNEDRELYVDLQLDDGIEPDADFPVGITTWRILQEDWRPQNWLIINRKTTSGDYSRLITAADWNFYVDLGDWIWRLLWGWGGWGICDCNVRRFVVSNLQDSTTWQAVIDWYKSGKYPILVYGWASFILEWTPTSNNLRFYDIHTTINNILTHGYSYTSRKVLYVSWDANDDFVQWMEDDIQITPQVLATNIDYQVAYTPLYDGSPTTKLYVDSWLALKQDKLTAGANITIDQNNVISSTIPSALVYKWNVNWIADLPSSWQTVWDTYFVEWADAMYSWDWTQWNYVGGTWISLNDYFNKTIDDSDDITQGSVNLFCTSIEKSYWNWKQDALTAWANIQISNNVISATDTTYSAWDWIAISNANVISNTAKFDPENAGSLGQFLKKTSTGYSWANIPWWWGWTTYTAWDGINISSGNVISNTSPFEPTNSWTTGQVLKKSGSSYYWADESWGWGWNFNPQNAGTTWQVLTKTATGYDWETLATWEGNVKLFPLSSTSDTTNAQAILDWYNAGKLPIIKYHTTISYTDAAGVVHDVEWDYTYYIEPKDDNSTDLHFVAVETANNGTVDNIHGWTRRQIPFINIASTSWTVTAVTAWVQSEWRLDFIAPNVDYTNPYIPTYDGSPATKKYVDSRNRVWTQTEYNNLPSSKLTDWVIYNIIPSS